MACKCGKPFSDDDYYPYQKSECKECVRRRVSAHRLRNIENIRAYDRKRAYLPHRIVLSCRVTSLWRNRGPAARSAQSMVSNAVRTGRILRLPCEICGNARVHAHHDDYLKPLNVRWLCAEHHKKWHMKNGPGINSEAVIPRRFSKKGEATRPCA